MLLLYKYRAVNNADQLQRLIEILSTGKFWFANGAEVNDPFEFRCAVGLSWNFAQTAEAFALVEMHLNQACSYSDALTKARTILGRLSRSRLKEREWELSYKMWRTWASASTMCCLAGTPTSILMWSHYASNHTGVAIEIEVPEELFTHKHRAEIHKVAYSDELPRINPLALIDMRIGENEGLFEALFLRKAKCWEYEQEYRILRLSVPSKSNLTSHQADLPKGCHITRVILGCEMAAEMRRQIEQIAAQQTPPIKVGYAIPSSEAKYDLSVVDHSSFDT